jgi:hypothetical protein
MILSVFGDTIGSSVLPHSSGSLPDPGLILKNTSILHPSTGEVYRMVYLCIIYILKALNPVCDPSTPHLSDFLRLCRGPEELPLLKGSNSGGSRSECWLSAITPVHEVPKATAGHQDIPCVNTTTAVNATIGQQEKRRRGRRAGQVWSPKLWQCMRASIWNFWDMECKFSFPVNLVFGAWCTCVLDWIAITHQHVSRHGGWPSPQYAPNIFGLFCLSSCIRVRELHSRAPCAFVHGNCVR